MPRKYTPEEAISAFWSKTVIAGEDDCWEWQACTNSEGYGKAYMFPPEQQAHRIAYFLAYGDFDRSLKVLHKCDNPPCCNPRHLFLGTDADNSRDRENKGRGGGRKIAGELNKGCKITDTQLQELRDRWAKREKCLYQLAEEYGITKTHASKLVRKVLR